MELEISMTSSFSFLKFGCADSPGKTISSLLLLVFVTKRKIIEYLPVIHGCQLWLMNHTILVLEVGVGSTLEQLQGTLPLASIGCTVQRSVT